MKPDPAIFRRVVEAIGASPGDCLFLDDTPGHVEGARRFGLNGIVFERGREAGVAAEVERWIAGSGGPA
jgi:FMN phosphatase YigB (HAD superfamily)